MSFEALSSKLGGQYAWKMGNHLLIIGLIGQASLKVNKQAYCLGPARKVFESGIVEDI